MSSTDFHERFQGLSGETRDMRRDTVSLTEEFESVDWYNQRCDACGDQEIEAILIHNRGREKEHAAMVLEWIRRRDQTFSDYLEEFLFTDKPVTHD